MLTVKPISIIQEISPIDTSDSEDMETKNQPVKSTPKLKVVAKPTILATQIPMPINSSVTSSPVKYNDFIKAHYTNKELSSQKPITNTRIGDSKLQMPGGSLSISKEEYPLFLKLYYDAIVADGKMEYLTEKQLENNCPILVDLDLRFSIDITKRQYTKEHIEDLVDCYLDEIKKIFQFDEKRYFKSSFSKKIQSIQSRKNKSPKTEFILLSVFKWRIQHKLYYENGYYQKSKKYGAIFPLLIPGTRF
jgi:hypothetical protein